MTFYSQSHIAANLTTLNNTNIFISGVLIHEKPWFKTYLCHDNIICSGKYSWLFQQLCIYQRTCRWRKNFGPRKTCLATSGVTVEPAKRGVHDGKGHHHILVDVDVPGDLSKPIGKDANHVHMGDGSKCKTLNLAVGKHTIRALFAKGNHVPYDPALTAKVSIEVLASTGITSTPKGASVSISEPADGAKISGPVKTCLATSGVTVEPAKRGVHDGKDITISLSMSTFQEI